MRAVILAGGKGTRLKSDRPKVLHPLFEKPLLGHVLDALRESAVDQVCVIVGHGREAVASWLSSACGPALAAGSIRTVVQEPQLGTGHAVMQVQAQLADWATEARDVLILSGDVPLLRAESLAELVSVHQAQHRDLTVLTAQLPDPTGYGRVIEEGSTWRIVEEKDATPAEKSVRTINTGIYCLNWQTVAPLLSRLSNQNAQNEYYLTDVVALAVQAGLRVGIATLADAEEMLGVNSRADLAACHAALNRRTLDRLMTQGVTVVDPVQTMVGPEVQMGADTVILPGCYLVGQITVGKSCVLGPQTTMTGSVTVGDAVHITHSVVRDTRIGDQCRVGPFAQLRDGVELSHHVHIGNFVEVKKTSIDHHTNAAHLAYLGDATLGQDVNIGAGTITANYDPIRDVKSQTRIADGAKIGSNSVLVAPVSVGESASVAAGSVITKDVAPHDLAIARGRQVAITGWVRRVRETTTDPSAGST